MRTFQDILNHARTLHSQIEEFRSSTYTVVAYDVHDTRFLFIASFDFQTMDYHYTLTDPSGIQLRGFEQVPAEVIAEYGMFISAMRRFANGEIEHPYQRQIVANGGADVIPQKRPHAHGPIDDHQFTSDEAKLR